MLLLRCNKWKCLICCSSLLQSILERTSVATFLLRARTPLHMSFSLQLRRARQRCSPRTTCEISNKALIHFQYFSYIWRPHYLEGLQVRSVLLVTSVGDDVLYLSRGPSRLIPPPLACYQLSSILLASRITWSVSCFRSRSNRNCRPSHSITLDVCHQAPAGG